MIYDDFKDRKKPPEVSGWILRYYYNIKAVVRAEKSHA